MQFRKAVVFAAVVFTASTASAQVDWHSSESVADAAVDGHPALASLRAQIAASRERAVSAGSYPNPMLMGGVENQQVNLSNDEMMTMYVVGASQSIPPSGRRSALRRSAELEVLHLELQAASLREEVRRNTLFAWYDLAAADSQSAATKGVREVVDGAVAAVRSRYEVGTAIQADVIRAQLRLSEIDHKLLTLEGQRNTAETRLLAQLGLPLTTDIPELHLPHATEQRGLPSSPGVPETHPALMAMVAEVEQRDQEILLARLLARPDWNLEASYGLRTEQTDMFSVVARVELPLRREIRVEPQVRAAIAEREAAAQRRETLRRSILEDLGIARAIHAEATKQLQFHEEVLVPQARLAFESTLAAYQAGRDNFESVLSSEAAWLALQIDFYEFLARHIKAVTDFEALQRGARNGAISAMSDAPMNPAVPLAGTLGTGMSSMR